MQIGEIILDIFFALTYSELKFLDPYEWRFAFSFFEMFLCPAIGFWLPHSIK